MARESSAPPPRKPKRNRGKKSEQSRRDYWQHCDHRKKEHLLDQNLRGVQKQRDAARDSVAAAATSVQAARRSEQAARRFAGRCEQAVQLSYAQLSEVRSHAAPRHSITSGRLRGWLFRDLEGSATLTCACSAYSGLWCGANYCTSCGGIWLP